MVELRLVVDADAPLDALADCLRRLGHWVPPHTVEQGIDAAIEASPPALQHVIGTRLRELGCDDGPEERVMFARLLELFVVRAPGALGRLEAAVDTGNADAAVAAASRLFRQSDALGAAPLARLCSCIAVAARTGDLGLPTTVRAALRRELAVTCRVLAGFGAELLVRSRPVAVPG